MIRPEPPARATFSLRRRLVLLGVLVLIVSLGAVGLALNAAFVRSAETSMQSRLESYVYLVLAAAEVAGDGTLSVDDALGDPRLARPGSGIYVHLHGKTQEWSSPSALGVSLPEFDTLEPGRTRYESAVGEGRWFVYQYGVAFEVGEETLPFTVTVLAAPAEFDAEVVAFRQGLWTWLGLAAALLVLAQLALLGLALRPLRRIAVDVGRVEAGESERLEGGHPRELEPLVRNVNRLLATEQSNQARYRNALDSLAHSLKTPLAAIRAGLAGLEGERAAELQGPVDDMHHLVDTRLRRASAATRRTHVAPVPVKPEAERVISALDRVYSQKMIRAELTMPEDTAFHGEKRDLLELLGNLLDNAYKYGRSRVRLSAGALEGGGGRAGLRLAVEDDGAGIDPAMAGRLQQRGVRGDEQAEGHGLGLALVAEVVTAYGGRIDFRRGELGGTLVEVELPAH